MTHPNATPGKAIYLDEFIYEEGTPIGKCYQCDLPNPFTNNQVLTEGVDYVKQWHVKPGGQTNWINVDEATYEIYYNVVWHFKSPSSFQDRRRIIALPLQAEKREGANEIIQPDRNFPLKIWANIYNPIKPDSWDLYFTENSAVRNAIGAKTHCYIHESIMANTKPQPPSGNLWEEVDAVKEPPGERDTVYEDVSVDCMIIFEDGTCKIGYYDYAAKEWRHYTKYNDTVSVGVKSYLRPVTGQRYSEEDGETIANWLMVNTSLNVEKIVDLKQFIQSLHLKSR